MKACKGLRNLEESSFYIQGWVDKGWKGKGRGRVGHSTKPEAKSRRRGETRADGGSLEAVRPVLLALGLPGSLASPRVDLVSDSDFRFDHYVAISPQGVDVTLYGGLAPHNIADVGIEDYWFR